MGVGMPLKLLMAAALAIAARGRTVEIAQDAPAPVFVANGIEKMRMNDAPIEPSWIVDGEPKARLSEHSKSFDGASVTAVWDCTAGTFRWFFGWDETVVILEGSVHVTAECGTQRTISAGDIAYFKAGTWATWQVDNYVRKVAFVRRPFPSLHEAAMKLKKAISGGAPAAGLAA